MARPRKTAEELMAVTVRLPVAFIKHVDEISAKTGVSRSDIIRPRIDTSDSSPISVTFNPAPQKRQRVAKASAADPKLMAQLAGIGNNLNQIARTVNSGVLTGQSVDGMSVLITLMNIEQQIKRLSAESKNAD